jgi:hypothetical protein
LPNYRSLKHLVLSTRPQFKVELFWDRSANGHFLETTPQLPPLQPSSSPAKNHPEIERISSKLLNRRALNQGIWFLDLADIRDIPRIRTNDHWWYVNSGTIGNYTILCLRTLYQLIFYKWKEISLDAFHEVELIFKSVVDELLKWHFGGFKSSLLLYNVRF